MDSQGPDILDFEASGFGGQSFPIEVGFCLANDERFCCLIKPDSNWRYWDQNAEAVHGISQAQLQEHGHCPADVCLRLNELLNARTLYSDAWVVDKAWLNKLYEAAQMQPSFQLRAIENIQSECQHLIWDRVRERMLKEVLFERHRASADAHFIQLVYCSSEKICGGDQWQEFAQDESSAP